MDLMSLMAMDLDQNSLGFYFLDKVAIVLLLLAAGLMSKYVLERTKTNLAFKNEMAKQRVAYIGQVWSACNELEAKSAQFVRDEVGRRVNPPRDLQRGADDTLSTTNEMLKQLEIVRTLAISTRFWLGEALYAHFCAFHQLNIDRLKYFRTCLEARTEPEARAAITKLQDVDAGLQRARQSVERYVKNPL